MVLKVRLSFNPFMNCVKELTCLRSPCLRFWVTSPFFGFQECLRGRGRVNRSQKKEKFKNTEMESVQRRRRKGEQCDRRQRGPVEIFGCGSRKWERNEQRRLKIPRVSVLRFRTILVFISMFWPLLDSTEGLFSCVHTVDDQRFRNRQCLSPSPDRKSHFFGSN